MAVSFVAAGVASASLFTGADASAVASGNLTSVPLPAGIADDDILVLVVHSKDVVGCSVNQSFTQKVATDNGAANQRLEVWYKRVSGAQTAPTITHTAGGPTCAVIYAFRGCETTGDPFEAAQANAEDESAATPFTNSGVTVTTPGSMAVLAFGSADDNSWTYNSGFASSVHFIRNQNGNDNSVGLAYGVVGAAVATGDLKVNQSALGADAGMTWSGILKSEAAYSGIGLVRQLDSGGSTSSVTTRNITIPVEAGLAVVLVVGWEGGATCSVADADTNTWTPALAVVDDGNNKGRAWTCVPATTRAALVVTLTFSAGSNFHEYLFHTLYGADTASLVDKTASNSGTGTAPSTGTTATTTVADEYLLAMLRLFQNVNYSAWTNSFGEVHDGNNFGVATRTVSATGAYSTAATASANDVWLGLIVTIKAASGSQALSGTSPSSTWGEAGTLAGAGAVALSGTSSASTWGQAGTLAASPVALAGTSPGSTWGQAGTLAPVSAPLSGTSAASTWGQGGDLAGAGSVALSGASALSTWGEAGTLTGAGAVALAGTSSFSTWGHDGDLAQSGASQALSGTSPASTWGQAGTLAAGTVALAGTSPASTWGHAGTLAPGAVALAGTSPGSTWGHDGALAAISAALNGASPFSTWGEAGTLAPGAVALAGTSPFSTWGHAGTLTLVATFERPGSSRYTPGARFRGKYLESPFKKRRNE